MNDDQQTTYMHFDEVDGARRAAEQLIPIILTLVRPTKSVVDLGGGTGAWLREFQNAGVGRIKLFDHPSVENHLLIPPQYYSSVNLATEVPPVERFDLAVCVECAEHLPASRAKSIVEWLTRSADQVVFSAAVIGQGGKHHVNEQFGRYWQQLFRDFGFVRRDIIRRRILEIDSIPWWYRQNLFLFVKEGVTLPSNEPDFIPDEFSLIHRNVENAYARPRVKSVPGYVARAITHYITKRRGGPKSL